MSYYATLAKCVVQTATHNVHKPKCGMKSLMDNICSTQPLQSVLCRQRRTSASAAASRQPGSAAPGLPAVEEEERIAGRRPHAASAPVSWCSAPAAGRAAGLAANPAGAQLILTYM